MGPDFSMYRNMLFVMQQWSCFKSRAISRWLQSEEVEVIPNVRISDERCFDWVFDGLPKHSVIAMSTLGCCKHSEDRRRLMRGIAATVEELEPEAIIVYGAAPDAIFEPAVSAGIRMVPFESQFSATHKEAMRNGNR